MGQTALDAVGLLPIIGALKYSDEAADLAKAGFKNIDEFTDLLQNGLKKFKTLGGPGEIGELGNGLEDYIDKAFKAENKAIDTGADSILASGGGPFSGASVEAYRCEVCKKIIIDYMQD